MFGAHGRESAAASASGHEQTHTLAGETQASDRIDAL